MFWLLRFSLILFSCFCLCACHAFGWLDGWLAGGWLAGAIVADNHCCPHRAPFAIQRVLTIPPTISYTSKAMQPPSYRRANCPAHHSAGGRLLGHYRCARRLLGHEMSKDIAWTRDAQGDCLSLYDANAARNTIACRYMLQMQCRSSTMDNGNTQHFVSLCSPHEASSLSLACIAYSLA